MIFFYDFQTILSGELLWKIIVKIKMHSKMTSARWITDRYIVAATMVLKWFVLDLYQNLYQNLIKLGTEQHAIHVQIQNSEIDHMPYKIDHT